MIWNLKAVPEPTQAILKKLDLIATGYHDGLGRDWLKKAARETGDYICILEGGLTKLSDEIDRLRAEGRGQLALPPDLDRTIPTIR